MYSPSSFYLLGISALALALGVQIILLPWLVVDYLSLTSVWVGWVQAAVLIPNLVLLLVGGVMADQGKGLPWLLPLLIVNMLIHAGLAIVIYSSWLNIFLVVCYASLLGVTNAFIQPWREYLLKQTSYASGPVLCAEDLQKFIAKSSLCLYAGQALGVALASFMDSLGVEVLLWIQVIMVAIAVLSFWYLRKRLADQYTASDIVVDELHANSSGQQLLLAGLTEVWKLPALRSLIAIVAFNGFFHIGVFIVALPLLVRQVYGETVDFYSGLQLAFVLGTIATTLIVIYRGFLDAPGRRIIFGLLYGGVILLALSARPTLTGLFMLIFCWGVVVGVSANMGRALVQSLAPEASRGRIISIYQLALFGFAPLGALFAGYAIELWGVLVLLKICGIASLLIFALTLTTRALWEVELKDQSRL
ncbi:MAG: MFS family permease [Candidatus Endobugula sp.]